MKYYEDKEIISEIENEDRTKTLTLNMGEENPVSELIISNWEYEVNSSETPIDASDARNNRAIYIVDAMYELVKTLDIPTNDISFIIQKFLSKVQGVEASAIENCFEKRDDLMRISDWEKKL